MIKRGFAVIMLTMLFLGGAVGVNALSPPLREPFVIYSQDKSKFFRFTPEEWINTEDRTIFVPPKLCVYYDTDPPQLVYEFEPSDVWVSMWVDKGNFYFSRDLMHLAFLMPLTGTEALKFYSKGVLARTYDISELVEDMEKVVESDWGFVVWLEDWPSLLQNDILAVTTIEARTFLFDITTGDIIDAEDYLVMQTDDETPETGDEDGAPETGDGAVFLCAIGFLALAGAVGAINQSPPMRGKNTRHADLAHSRRDLPGSRMPPLPPSLALHLTHIFWAKVKQRKKGRRREIGEASLVKGTCNECEQCPTCSHAVHANRSRDRLRWWDCLGIQGKVKNMQEYTKHNPMVI